MSIERQRAVALALWVGWALISVVATFGWGILWNLAINGLYGPRNLLILQLFGLFVTIPVIFSLLSGDRTAPNIFVGGSSFFMQVRSATSCFVTDGVWCSWQSLGVFGSIRTH